MTPTGSSRAFSARSASTPCSPISPAIHGTWSRPTAWWWVIVRQQLVAPRAPRSAARATPPSASCPPARPSWPPCAGGAGATAPRASHPGHWGRTAGNVWVRDGRVDAGGGAGLGRFRRPRSASPRTRGRGMSRTRGSLRAPAGRALASLIGGQIGGGVDLPAARYPIEPRPTFSFSSVWPHTVCGPASRTRSACSSGAPFYML